MNTIVKNISLFLAGSVIGSGITYILLKRYYTKANEELCMMLEQESQDLHDRVRELEDKQDMDSILSSESYFGVDEQSEVNPVKKGGFHGGKKPSVEYDKFYVTESGDDDEPSMDELEHPEDDIPSPPIDPYIISYSEFTNENPFYSKAHLSYYAEDEVLADEHDEIVDDIYGNIGDSALHSFGMDPEDPDIVYVRNDNRSIDFEITRIDGSYSEMVLGEYEY